MLTLRDYQSELTSGIHNAWNTGSRNVCAVLPTGGGKTVVFAHILNEFDGQSFAVAHRQELVSQISMALANFGLDHNIVAPTPTIKWIIGMQAEKFGRPYFSPRARCTVAGVDTLIKRKDIDRKRVGLWVIDECHHLLKENKWGKAVSMFPNAKGLGVTATPIRADGRGLSRGTNGVLDSIVVGPSMRQLITRGYMSDYRIFAPLSHINMSNVNISQATGDFNSHQLRKAVHESQIVGDIIENYKRFAPGKLGVTFVVDVQTATDVASAYNAAGIRAEAVSAKTPGRIRQTIIDRFRRRELLQLVNVDLFGEGFDLPAIEAISMGRPTESFPLYCQQFGRSLRPMEGKERAIIIDHVGNTLRHGLPDRLREWSLAPNGGKAKKERDPNEIPMTICQNCDALFPRFAIVCPLCGHKNEPAGRSAPEMVDGDLLELDAETLARMRGEVARIDESPAAIRERMLRAGAPNAAAFGAAARHRERQAAQAGLRYSIERFAEARRAEGMPDAEIYRRFYHRFGIDILTAQTVGRPEAERLIREIWAT